VLAIKVTEFREVTSPNADLAALTGLYNLGFDGTDTHYWATYSGTNAYTKEATLTGATSTTYTHAVGITIIDAFVRTVREHIYTIVTYDNGGSGYGTKVYKDGALVITAASASYLDMRGVDVLIHSTYGDYLIAVVKQNVAMVDRWYVLMFNAGGAGGSASDVASIDSFYRGKQEADIYYMGYYDTSDDFIEISNYLDTGANDFGQAVQTFTDPVKPAVYDIDKQMYFDQGGSKFIIDEDHFYYRKIDEWASIASSGEANIGVVWNFDAENVNIVKYLSWKDTLYKVFEGGGFGKFMDFSPDSRVGFVDWINDPTLGDVYQHTITATKGTTTVNPIKAVFNTTSQIVTILDSNERVAMWADQYYEIYDDNDVFVADGFITSFKKNEDLNLEIEITTPYGLDLKKKITYSDSGLSDTAMFAAINPQLDYVTLVITGDAGTRDHKYDKTTLSNVIEETRIYQKMIDYYSDLTLTLDDGTTDTGVAITEADTIIGFKYSKSPFQVKTVKVIGGFAAGGRITSTKVNDTIVDGVFLQLYFPNIVDQTQLNTLATSVITQEGGVVTKFKFKTYDKGIIQYGQQLTFSDTRRAAIDTDFNTPTLYFILETEYDIISDITSLTCCDTLIFKIDRKRQGARADVNESLIEQVSTTVAVGAPDHNALNGLNDGTDYEHITQAQKTALHATYTNADAVAAVEAHANLTLSQVGNAVDNIVSALTDDTNSSYIGVGKDANHGFSMGYKDATTLMGFSWINGGALDALLLYDPSDDELECYKKLDMKANLIENIQNGGGPQDAMAFGQKYTDANAVSAMGAVGDGNNLNHVKTVKWTTGDTEGVITAELVDGQSIDLAIDALIATHKALPNDHHTPTVAGDLAHNSLTGLNDGTDYEHITQTQKDALHAVYTDDKARAAVGPITTMQTWGFSNFGTTPALNGGAVWLCQQTATSGQLAANYVIPRDMTVSLGVSYAQTGAFRTQHGHLYIACLADGEAFSYNVALNQVWDWPSSVAVYKRLKYYYGTDFDVEEGDTLSVYFIKDTNEGAGGLLVNNFFLKEVV